MNITVLASLIWFAVSAAFFSVAFWRGEIVYIPLFQGLGSAFFVAAVYGIMMSLINGAR